MVDTQAQEVIQTAPPRLDAATPSLRHGGEKPVPLRSPEQKKIPDHITVATHCQKAKHLLGDGETRGVLEQVQETGLDTGYRLRSKEENNYLHVPVKAESAYGGGDPYEKGERDISLCSGYIEPYGEMKWVMLASSFIQKGSMVDMDGIDKRVGQRDGLSGRTGELGYYSPLAQALEHANSEREALQALHEAADTLRAMDRFDSKFIPALEYWRHCDIGKGKTFDDFFMQRLGKPMNQITAEDFDRFLTEETALHEQQQQENEQLAEVRKDKNGIKLYNPFTVCFVPRPDITTIHARIDAMGNVSDNEKTFMKRQFIPYDSSDTDIDFKLNAQIHAHTEKPREYAEIVLGNVRSYYQDPGLQVEDVLDMMAAGEERIGAAHFRRSSDPVCFDFSDSAS